MVLENYLDGEISLDDAVELTGDLNKAQTIIKGFAKFNKLLTDNWKAILAQTKVDTDLNMSINQLSDTLNTLQKMITRG